MRSVAECYRGDRVRVFRLDRERILSQLRDRAARVLRSRPEVLEIRLFGSLARGDAKPGSDADLWVLLADCPADFVERGRDLSREFSGVGIGCDIVAYSQAEWDAMTLAGRRFVAEVEAGSIVLASRRHT